MMKQVKLWILLNNQKQKIRKEAIYGPQENMTPNNELKLLCKTIAEEIEIAKEKYQKVLTVGDLNVKMGNHMAVFLCFWRQQRNSIKREKTAQKNN